MRFVCLTLGLLCFAISTQAQNSYQNTRIIDSLKEKNIRSGRADSPSLNAFKLDNDAQLELDGLVNEEVWNNLPTATHFTQRAPDDGARATKRTEAKVLYTNSHIYVGINAYDSAPDSIVAPLFRRDGNESSDWVTVGFDSYNDQRTGFVFGVNPRGVQRDFMIINDTNEDFSWNAVWEAKAQITDFGWSAEMKIPLSQLRFNAKADEQQWGVNFQRSIARTGEDIFWKPTPQSASGIVSNFAELNGIKNLSEPRRLEVMPYVSADLTRVPNQNTANPYYEHNDFAGRLGADIKYGITSDMTLSATINPDFGQVEADPAVINLTANENFFSEKRPFFLEGRDIFQFGETKTFMRYNAPRPFYSRRIGRSPQGSPSRADMNSEYSDVPDFTTIATAAKLSGKTKNGWSVGLLDAYTVQENADYTLGNGNNGSIAVEPATNYLVGRVKKDFNKGNTYVGGFATAVNRSLDGRYFEDFMHSSAYVVGADYEHQFADQKWVASGALSVSSVQGSPDAIARTQRSPVRYFNRVDSDVLSVDEDETALQGFSTELSLKKQGGDDPWLAAVTYSQTSPGYEVNDLGFQTRADLKWVGGVLVYRETDPDFLRYYEVFLGHDRGWNYDGDQIRNSVMNGGYFSFNNQWSFRYNLGYNFKQYNDRISRGGPVIERPKDWNLRGDINTDRSKDISFNLGGNIRREVAGEFDNAIWANVNYRPTSFIQLSFGPQYTHQADIDQYITAVEDDNATHTYGKRYVFSDIEQHTISANLRLNWTFSPTMSLQTYIRPFVSTGDFTSFKEVAQPRTYNYDVYGEDIGSIEEQNGTYTIDPDGSGSSSSFSFADPDFNFRSVQGNAVFRWEYTPGSTLYLVWQQQREDYSQIGAFNLGDQLNDLFDAKPTNVFLVKLSYWFGR
ncbi:DUF5916 domain-containing protein [Gracilimonas sp.]|uniref:DUF5916 domain-containing protein n=1 Tax=Gracilimonas sp. TaxID=1974203 RepID=UPI002871C810|nr:DUF5916 domain-containing protein [Gracilimonas sp.]